MKRGVIFGIFDLLHVGHVKVLQAAKEYCDHLTVCIFNDDIAESYKRKPIISDSERVEMILALKCIDDAYLIDFRAPIDMKEIDVYFVSETLRGKTLYMVPHHRQRDVIYLPYSEGINSSTVIKRCQGQS